MEDRQVSLKQMLDAVDEMPVMKDNNGIEFIEKSLAKTRIWLLPSAQPDGIPLEWINKHLEWLDNCDNDFAQLAKVSIRAMVECYGRKTGFNKQTGGD